MEIEMREMARSGEIKTNAKARPLFTGGKGKKKELGKNLWTKEGIKYYNTGEKNWRKVYKDEFRNVHVACIDTSTPILRIKKGGGDGLLFTIV